MSAIIEIPHRFNGPPDSGNGGYSCGVLAGHVHAPAVEVSLRRPPPLERPLRVEEREGVVVALDGDEVVAEARPVALELETPPAVSVEDAYAADARSTYRDAELHWFDTCFVCGPSRGEGDGLRMFPGLLEQDGDQYATVFRPDATVAGHDGRVRPEVVWAALDCPTSAPIADWNDERPPSVLARFGVRIGDPPRAGRSYVVRSWPLGEDGRKRHAAAAMYGPDGQVVALARALWIELRARPE